jgi:hypothetical protein
MVRFFSEGIEKTFGIPFDIAVLIVGALMVLAILYMRMNDVKKVNKKTKEKKRKPSSKKEDNIYTYISGILAFNAIVITVTYFFDSIPNFYPFEINGFYIVISWIAFALINNKADYGTWTYNDKE